MMILVVLKIVFLFLAVMFGFVNISRLHYKQDVPMGNFILMTVGIVGFIALHFGLV